MDEMVALEPALRRYFRRRAAAHEIDDLVQEVFVSLQARRAENPVEDLERYLFTVAANALHRKLGRDRRWAYVEFDDKSASEDASPERASIGRQQLDKALKVIAGLSPRTRQIFVLHRFEEMTYPRISRELGISVSAVEKHIMAALRALGAAGLP